MKPIILSTFAMRVIVTKYKDISVRPENPLRVQTQVATELALSEFEMKDFAQCLPVMQSSSYISDNSNGREHYVKELEIPDYILAEKYLYDAVMVLFDHINDRQWLNDHVVRENGHNVARYSYAGLYYGEITKIDMQIAYDFDTRIAPVVTIIGYDSDRSTKPVDYRGNADEFETAIDPELEKVVDHAK